MFVGEPVLHFHVKHLRKLNITIVSLKALLLPFVRYNHTVEEWTTVIEYAAIE